MDAATIAVATTARCHQAGPQSGTLSKRTPRPVSTIVIDTTSSSVEMMVSAAVAAPSDTQVRGANITAAIGG
nr:hypothetical protein CPGR_05013 [Mycolicibacter nonchromogenicus]